MTSSSNTAARKFDPVVTEIIRNGMFAATEEMKSNLMRTAYSMIIYEALDFTVGLFDRAGRSKSTRLNSSHPRLSRMPSSA